MLSDLNKLELELDVKIQSCKEQFSIDCELPESFKASTRRIEGSIISYSQYGFKVSSTLDIYFPNQLWYLAAICTPLYIEVTKYGDELKNNFDKEKIKECKDQKDKAKALLKSANYSAEDKDLLVKFLSDYRWWKGGKTIDRADYYYTPIITTCKLVNASQSYIAEMCKYLSSHQNSVDLLLDRLESLPKPNYVSNIIIRSTQIREFLSMCIIELLSFDENLSLMAPSWNFRINTIGFTGFRIGKLKKIQDETTDTRRHSDCDKNVIWTYNNEEFYLYLEQTSTSIKVFADNLNIIYDPYYEIKILNNEYVLIKKHIPLVPFTNLSNIYRTNKLPNLPLQQIYYGAPGTGKSHKIEELIEKNNIDKANNVFRTTFHPDSDYSTFVGAYKPTKEKKLVRNVAGNPVVENGAEVYEDTISYKFIPQSFLKAYTKAWQCPDEPVVLVIEEINRGNCAQIFGDLFQLLDRKSGKSEYPIKADEDLCKYLKEEFGEEFEGIKNDELCLPSNLYIWATMNTSDQSLFPIDSAFKRRWDWKYIPIDTAKESWMIKVNGNLYDWTSFLNKINTEIYESTQSEDKQLGFYFIKADSKKIISAEKFVSKVLFYIYNDVFKDYDYDKDFFKYKEFEEKKITFRDLFENDGKIKESIVAELLNNLEITHTEAVNAELDSESNEEISIVSDEDTSKSVGANTKDKTKFSINGEGKYGKNTLVCECIKVYAKNNPSNTAQEVQDFWKSIDGVHGNYIYINENDKPSGNNKKTNEIKCFNSKLYVINDSYSGLDDIYKIIGTVNSNESLGIKIEKVNEN